MRKIIYNGKIYISRNEFVQAILIEDSEIKQVGSNEEILKNDDIDETIDCLGKTVIPGFNDSHMHMLLLGKMLYEVKISDCKTIDEIIDRCKDYIKKYPEKAKNGIHAQGWNENLFIDEKRIPTRFDLDKISTKIPIVLERYCGHTVSANTKAIEILKLSKDSKQYEGGFFELDENGYPNGVFRENACNYARKIIPPLSIDKLKEIFIEISKHLVSCGTTSVQSNDIGAVFPNDKKYFDLIDDIYENNNGIIRYRHQLCFNTPQDFEKFLNTPQYKKHKSNQYKKNPFVTIGPIKLFKDGSIGSRTALLKDGYIDDKNYKGIESISDCNVDEYCKIAKRYNVQVISHAIGDSAIEKILNSYEKVLDNDENKMRNTILHCQITDKILLNRIAQLGILVNYQPIFLDSDIYVINKRCEENLIQTSYAFSTLNKLGGKISYSTDCPIADYNPFLNIYCAVNRKDLNGYPDNGFNKDECVDVYTAIDAYTEGSAYMEFMEDKKGRIKPGYLADLVILDKDIFTCDTMEIKNILPLLTMVGGKIVYRKNI